MLVRVLKLFSAEPERRDNEAQVGSTCSSLEVRLRHSWLARRENQSMPSVLTGQTLPDPVLRERIHRMQRQGANVKRDCRECNKKEEPCAACKAEKREVLRTKAANVNRRMAELDKRFENELPALFNKVNFGRAAPRQGTRE